MTYKTALAAIPIVVFFVVDFSGIFNYSTPLNALPAHIYFNARSIALTMSLVLLALMALRRVKIPVNGFAKQIADHSAFIYLSEPFISFVILTYVFGQGESFFVSGPLFYLYQGTRIMVLLVVIPLGFLAFQYRPKITMAAVLSRVRVGYKNLLFRR